MCILHLHMFHWFYGYFRWFFVRFFFFFLYHQKDIVVFNRASGLSDVTNQKQEFKYQTSLCKYQGLKVRVKRSYSTILYLFIQEVTVFLFEMCHFISGWLLQWNCFLPWKSNIFLLFSFLGKFWHHLHGYVYTMATNSSIDRSVRKIYQATFSYWYM